MATKRATPLDIERGLTAYAITGDSDTAAAQTGLNARTIRLWRHKHPEKWAAITTKRAALIDQACIEEFRQVVIAGTQATREAINLARRQLAEGTIKDAASTARNLATASAIAADKIAVMEGRPTSIIEHRSSEDVLRELQRRGFVDATAHELPEQPPSLLPARAETNAQSSSAAGDSENL